MLNPLLVKEKITQFYIEDNQYGDLATHIFDQTQEGTLTLKSKDEGIFCGEVIIKEAFPLLDSNVVINLKVKDGEAVYPSDIIAEIKGPVYVLLTMERIVLNLIQRMSGIATQTKQIVDKITHTSTNIVDTRKTTPGLGIFEKYAVTVGGGLNHRRSLNDGLMLKDNHIAFSKSMETAIANAKKVIGPMDKIEVEIENEEMLKTAIDNHVDIIMFDNQKPEWIAEHLKLVPDTIQTEASGNINASNVVAYAETGVDYISMGSLFYAQSALDISAKVVI